MAKPFTEYEYDDARLLFGEKAIRIRGRKPLKPAAEVRRPISAIAASDFYAGDHWQDSDGFIGQLPPASLPGAAQIQADIESGFVSENVIREVVETHVGGVLGREPLWSFLPEQRPGATQKPEKDETTGGMATPWWNEREALKDLQRSAEVVLLEGVAVKRIFFPKALRDDDGAISAGSIPDALDFLYFETLHSDTAGVFTDPDTQQKIGIYLFDEKDDEGNILDTCAELSFLNDDGDTVCRIVKDKGQPEEFEPYKLGGRLLLHELKRSPLITAQVQSSQKALNLAHTMMMRNVNLAGARERTVSNAQDPKRPRKVQDPTRPSQITQLEPGNYEVGAGAVMFLMGFPIRNEKGDIVGYTNPNVSISDPAPVDVFRQTIEQQKAAIYSQCHQRHVLITDDAATSGISRQQARAEFERSLKETKTVLDAAGRWQLETALRLAAFISGQGDKYLKLRADFNCLIDAGDVDPEKVRLVMEMREEGGPKHQPLISDERARQLAGVEDPEAELKKIEEEAPTDAEIRKRQELMTPPQELNRNNGAIA